MRPQAAAASWSEADSAATARARRRNTSQGLNSMFQAQRQKKMMKAKLGRGEKGRGYVVI
jgi:hypothetical protein